MQGIIVDSVTEQSLQTFTVGHADALEVFRRFVRADGRRAGLGDAPAGVCRIASTAADELLPVDTAGLVQVEAGAAIALGPGGVAPVKAAADGRAVPVGDLDPDPVAGIAVAAATAAGAFVPVLLVPSDPMRTMQVEHDDTNEVLNRFVCADVPGFVAGWSAGPPIRAGRTRRGCCRRSGAVPASGPSAARRCWPRRTAVRRRRR